jgi:hypothetical protein
LGCFHFALERVTGFVAAAASCFVLCSAATEQAGRINAVTTDTAKEVRVRFIMSSRGFASAASRSS